MIKSLKFTTAFIVAVGASILATSCSSRPEPKKIANYLNASCNTAVYGYNGRSTVKARTFTQPYALQENAKKALVDYIDGSHWQEVSYIFPQMFVKVNSSVWAICSDNRGNMTGVLPVGKNKDARKLQESGNYKLLVNDTERGPALGYAVLKNLNHADQMRVNLRKSEGLETIAPLAPAAKPVKVTPAPTAPTTTPAVAKPKTEAPAEENASEGSDEEDTTTDDTTTEDGAEDTTSSEESGADSEVSEDEE